MKAARGCAGSLVAIIPGPDSVSRTSPDGAEVRGQGRPVSGREPDPRGPRHTLAVDLVVHARRHTDGLQPFALDALARERLGAVAKGQHRGQGRGAHDDAQS